MDPRPDIAANRLSPHCLAINFADAHPPLTGGQASIEADRCYFCYDAPCVEACPTGIDIPGFIRGIATGNLAGAAHTILESNILGGSCARVCPTEILCEGACVRTAQEEKPVVIGALQRHATDWQMDSGTQPFSRAAETGRHIAIVGAGPAGLACAHRLAMHGHAVTILDARPRAGGLNEYGIAAYKLPDDFAQHEIDFIAAIGGITIQTDRILGRDVTLADLEAAYDAVFLAIGQAGVRMLGIEGENLDGVMNAVDFIAGLRASATGADVPIGRRVVVIGGGNTAIDAAVQARRLGAEEVTLVYRRGAETMSATGVEKAWAQTNGVTIRTWAAPLRLDGVDGTLRSVTFTRGRLHDGRPVHDQGNFTLEADMVLKAVGQLFLADPLDRGTIAIENGRIAVDDQGRTTRSLVYAGGDCTPGADLTVVAVRDGRNAAEAIHADLTAATGA
ncbi:oxidoreductase [Gluconacetobacter liquefaciens]|uniref:Glutamate synthase (NADPH/NADH) small chain n=1 Tax=Gluconacetobacter liquefaciens TaxID=89584 RepID=A0A370G6H1_GLULI|nr:NAD(P)-dependent oxidoreductase [Gluconacetobacter liquefaciens]MBB2185617.1 NAD(P)-dependent oxidoreductase [Gluconacetobacter liquefaciens]RDI39421.1 glutamate synthase (NADPH/NADH) small chain [Gluconacetobacter liquefaciens]GBR00477.1 oxidoreductase [Gluconacetobacter liquefaciens NRIC 0522]GEB36063.1 oxidoreductase [Gluconacetobacter liquefaciens]